MGRAESAADGAKNGEHRQGSEWAACFVVGFAAAAYAAYAALPGVLTGAVLGCAGAWIGLTIQHCGNHGAMSTKPWVNSARSYHPRQPLPPPLPRPLACPPALSASASRRQRNARERS